MYMPSIFGESLFDDMFPFDDSFFTSKKNPLYGKNASRVMKTDIKENEGSYELDIDLPGFKKDDCHHLIRLHCRHIQERC